MLIEDPGDTAQGVLVQESVHALDDLFEREQHVLEEVDGESGVAGSQRRHVRGGPQRHARRRQSDRVRGGRTTGDRHERPQITAGHDPRHDLATVDGRSPAADMALQDESDA